MATSSKEWNAQVRVKREDREAVLSVISASQSVTIEELLHHLPWMRWGHLFSILGECLQEGSVILCQKGFQFEVQALHPSQSGSGADVSTASVPSSSERYHLTRS
jgi:hypothetical protein